MSEHAVAPGAMAERVLGFVNGGAMALMISIGHQTGLFDAMAGMKPSTSAEIASAAGLNERYVREWLGAMTAGGIVTYCATDRKFSLPAEAAAILTRAATPNNMATFTQWIAVLGGVEDRIVECFHKGGGVPYSEYRRFHSVMAEESGQTTVAALGSAIIPAVPGLEERLRAGAEVLDVGCGSGHALSTLAKLHPRSRFTGRDFSADAIAAARAYAAEMGAKNVVFEVADAAQMKDAARFDLITAFDAIHDQAQPDAVLLAIARALKDDGVFLMQDIGVSSHVERNLANPIAPLVYTISCMHCMSVSLAQGGMGLGAAWGEEKAVEMLGDAGFGAVSVNRLEHDIQNYYYIARKK